MDQYYADKIHHGSIASIEKLLNERQYEHDYVESMLVAAVEEGYKNIVLLLLKQKTLDEHAVNRAASAALGLGKIDIFELLYDIGLVKDEAIGGGLVDAAYNGESYAVMYAYKLGDNIKRYVGDALVAAASGGHTEIVKTLLSTNRASEKQIKIAFLSSVGGGHEDMMALLFENVSINDETLDSAFHYACAGGNMSIINFILDLIPEPSDDSLDQGLINAATKGHPHVVKMILRMRNISKLVINNAMLASSGAKDPNAGRVVKILLSTHKVDDITIINSVKDHTNILNQESTKLLLKTGRLPQSSIILILGMVAARGSFDMVRFMMKNYEVAELYDFFEYGDTDGYYDTILSEAKKSSTLKYVLDNFTFDHHYLMEACGNDYEMDKVILSNMWDVTEIERKLYTLGDINVLKLYLEHADIEDPYMANEYTNKFKKGSKELLECLLDNIGDINVHVPGSNLNEAYRAIRNRENRIPDTWIDSDDDE